MMSISTGFGVPEVPHISKTNPLSNQPGQCLNSCHRLLPFRASTVGMALSSRKAHGIFSRLPPISSAKNHWGNSKNTHRLSIIELAKSMAKKHANHEFPVVDSRRLRIRNPSWIWIHWICAFCISAIWRWAESTKVAFGLSPAGQRPSDTQT